MNINEKQALFAYHIAKLIVWAHEHGYPVIGAEWYRTPEQAAIYASQGKGIKNSNHTRKLALDLFRLKDGKVTWDLAEYEPLAKQWRKMHPLARAGIDFKNRDAVHFSFQHEGVV